jgi:hypothetical protein
MYEITKYISYSVTIIILQNIQAHQYSLRDHRLVPLIIFKYVLFVSTGTMKHHNTTSLTVKQIMFLLSPLYL